MPQEHIEWALPAIDHRRDHYALFRDYYDGDHRLLFASTKMENAFGARLRAMTDNLCPAPVDAIRDRLRVRGFGGAGGDLAWQVWTALGLERRSADVHAEAAKCGDQFVIVWSDAASQPRVWPQTPGTIAVLYDDEGDPSRLVRAAKVWKATSGPYANRWRVNLYYVDHLERYVSRAKNPSARPKAGGFILAEDHPDGLGPIVPNPWGVLPVFHFAHNPQSVGELGRSKLSDVVPLQDGLNKTICDMLVTGEFHALPQRYATGVQTDIDPLTGKPVSPWTSQPGGVWTIPEAAATAGTFAAADLRQFLEVINDFRMECARVSGTPLAWFQLTTEPPSGESQKVLEGRFVKSCERLQHDWGPTWAGGVMSLLLRMMAGTTEAPAIEASWEPAGTRDELHETSVQEAKLRIHGSWRQACRELGYSDEQIEELADERTADAAAAAAASLAAFDRGVGGLPVGQFAGVAAVPPVDESTAA